MFRILLTAWLLFASLPAHAEIPIPIPFGDWKLACYTAPATCSVYIRTENIEKYRTRVGPSGVSVSVDLDGGNYYRVRSFGHNVITCNKILIDEDVQISEFIYYRSPIPQERYYDDFVNRLQAKLSETIDSHLAMMGNCSPTNQRLGDFPIELFHASKPYFARAIAAMAERVRLQRPKAHLPPKPSS